MSMKASRWSGLPRWLRIGIIIFGVLFVIGLVADTGEDDEGVTSAPDATEPATAPTQDDEPETTRATRETTTTLPGIPGSGTFRVGADVESGTYRTAGPARGSSLCYWERRSDLTGEFGGIIANENLEGPGVVAIAASDVGFKTSGCQRWEKVE